MVEKADIPTQTEQLNMFLTKTRLRSPFNGKLLPLGLGIPTTLPDGTVDLNKLDTNFVPYAAIKNNRENFFVTGITNQFDVGYSSGDEKGGLYVGFQNVNVNGVIPDDKSSRTNVRIGGSRNYGNFKAIFSFL